MLMAPPFPRYPYMIQIFNYLNNKFKKKKTKQNNKQ